MKKVNFQFIWIKKWRTFEDFSMSFSSKYIFKKDNNLISIIRNDKYIDNFFGENVEANVIVGKNGCGKTSLLEFLLGHCSGDFEPTNYMSDSISIFEDEEENGDTSIIICAFMENQRYCEKVKLNDGRILIDINDIRQNDIRDSVPFFVFVTESLNFSRTIEFHGSNIISPANQINGFYTLNRNLNPLISYYYESTIKQLKFLLLNKEIIKNLEMIFPDEICFDFVNYKQNESIFIKNLRDKSENSILIDVTKIILLNVESVSNYNIENKLMSSYEGNNLFSCLKSLFLDADSCNIINCNEWLDFLLNLEKIMPKCESDKNHLFYKIKMSDLEDEHIRDFLVNFISACQKLSLDKPLVHFSFPLSSGEVTVLNTLGNLLEYKNNKKFKNDSNLIEDNVVLLIDEGENALHPDWQRRYVNLIVNYLKNFSLTHFQLIFTTHSPIILSDFPKDRVTLLKNKNGITKKCNDELKETLGSNIYELFSSAYILPSFIGEFAEGKINDLNNDLNILLSYINNKNPELILPIRETIDKIDKDLQLIDEIGEPVLKNELRRAFLYCKERLNQ